jgi:hypothetical protein
MFNAESLGRVVFGLVLDGTALLGAYMIWRPLRDFVAERQAVLDHKPERRAKH